MTEAITAPVAAAGPANPAPPRSSREACRQALVELARLDPRVICVDADTGGLEDAFADLPDQYLNVGIAEANLIGVSAGLAAAGFLPYAHTISSFAAARACEQIKIDVAGNNLPVRMVVSHGGLSAGHYGPTHHAAEDIAIMRTMPNMTVLVPADAAAAERALRDTVSLPGPAFLRLGRSATPAVAPGGGRPEEPRIGRARTLVPGDDVTLVATGPYPVLMALTAGAELARLGVAARVLDLHTVKPLDRAAIVAAACETAGLVTVEDHLLVGGAGSAVCEVVAEEHPCRVRRVGIPDAFCDRVGDEHYLLTAAGVSPERIVAAALGVLGRTGHR